MTKSLGSLDQVALRNIWPHEANDFTPWLAMEENMNKLGDALGLELETEEVECSVGPYSADIVARDATGQVVVIENQLEKTNHDHLGKCLTYASVLDASTVIWIASSFTDEHKKAFDWLNDKSGLDLSFFGVRLELWSIDGSNPAVRFNVVSAPADIVKRAHQKKLSAGVSETKQLQFRWWTAVRDALMTRGIVKSPQAANPRYWYNISLGRSGFGLSCTANVPQQKISVRLYLRAIKGGQQALDTLIEKRETIESEIGTALEWNPNPNARDKTVRLVHKADISDEASWPAHIDWMLDTIELFKAAFSGRVKALNIDLDNDEDELGDE